MERAFVRTLLLAWDRPEFRAGLQHLIDLDEVTALLAALAGEHRDPEVELRALELLRSALETAEIRRAVLLLVEADDVRQSLAAAVCEALADRPRLAEAIRSALDDPAVRTQLRAALESGALREVLWRAADDQFRGRRWALAREVAVLFLRHRHARRLVWLLKRHGVVRELRRRP
jgi:hypothetical protein